MSEAGKRDRLGRLRRGEHDEQERSGQNDHESGEGHRAERERADATGHRPPGAGERDEAGAEPNGDVGEKGNRHRLGGAKSEQGAGSRQGEEQVPARRHVEAVDELHPGEQAGERDLDRAELADSCAAPRIWSTKEAKTPSTATARTIFTHCQGLVRVR